MHPGDIPPNFGPDMALKPVIQLFQHKVPGVGKSDDAEAGAGFPGGFLRGIGACHGDIGAVFPVRSACLEYAGVFEHFAYEKHENFLI